MICLLPPAARGIKRREIVIIIAKVCTERAAFSERQQTLDGVRQGNGRCGGVSRDEPVAAR